MNKKLSKDELEEFLSVNQRYITIRDEIADNKIRGASLMNQYPTVAGELYSIQAKIKEKYGDVIVDAKTGALKHKKKENVSN
jgi:hypothetical protein